MAEWSIAAVLKTVEGYTSGGSNPSFSANIKCFPERGSILYLRKVQTKFEDLDLIQNAYRRSLKHFMFAGSPSADQRS